MMTPRTRAIDPAEVLTTNEIKQVLSDLKRRAKRAKNARLNLTVFRLSACCGLRASELCGLRMSDLHLTGPRPYIQVRKEIAKRAKSRRVPLTWDKGTLADLQTWHAERMQQGATAADPYICTLAKDAFGKRLDRINARHRFQVACKSLSRPVTIHMGRHTFLSHALHRGRTLAEVQQVAGHANLVTTSIYCHVLVDEKDERPDVFGF